MIHKEDEQEAQQQLNITQNSIEELRNKAEEIDIDGLKLIKFAWNNGTISLMYDKWYLLEIHPDGTFFRHTGIDDVRFQTDKEGRMIESKHWKQF